MTSRAPGAPDAAASAPRGGKRQAAGKLPPRPRHPTRGGLGLRPLGRCPSSVRAGPPPRAFIVWAACAAPRALAVPPRPACSKGHARPAGHAGRWPCAATLASAPGRSGRPVATLVLGPTGPPVRWWGRWGLGPSTGSAGPRCGPALAGGWRHPRRRARRRSGAALGHAAAQHLPPFPAPPGPLARRK